MLAELVVEGLGVIDRAELRLSTGSSALTGETGAGKTLLVAAVGLLLGDRGDRVLVRQGRGEARVEGRFVVPADHPSVAVLAGAGIAEVPGDGSEIEIVVARSITAGDRPGRVRINGRLATVGLLSEVMADLVEVTSQHEHVRVARPSFQRGLLDAFAGPEAVALAASVAEEVRTASRTRKQADELAGRERERSRAIDVLRFQIGEIENAAIQEGEWERLAADARRLEQAEAIAAAVAEAEWALRGEPGAEDLVVRAEGALSPVTEADPALPALVRRLEAVSHELSDVAAELVRLTAVEPDPGALEAVRHRRAVLAGLRRKYGDDEAGVLAWLEQARAQLRKLQSQDEAASDFAAQADSHAARAGELAAELSELRAGAAVAMQEAVRAALGDLAMGGAEFEVRLVVRDVYEGGGETVEFLLAANPGESPRSLAKVASGGELARVALALHLVTATTAATSMVFDEVDAGVGGTSAQAVGRSLARLARVSGAQVLVVTHLPQVAAHADAHYRVSKAGGSAIVERIDGEERVRELSRMLAGLPESERARDHAEELLEMAAAEAQR